MNVFDVLWRKPEDAADLVFVVEVDFGDGNFWDTLVAWWSPSRRMFFWVSDRGCSCDSLGEDVRSIEQLEAGDRAALISAIRNKYAEKVGRPEHQTDMLTDLAAVRTF